jgi:FkbM family methyltransferase
LDLPSRVARSLGRRLVRRLTGNAELTYAQEGEDRILARMLERAAPGFYVDVGAHDPSRFSNTAGLYRAGWSGIVIDPRPGFAARFRKSRPRDVALEVGVAEHAREMTYFRFNDEALSTFDADRAATLEATTAYRIVATAVVKCLPLAELLGRHLPAGRSVDLLTVDVEGLDLEVLRSNDWQRFRPALVVAEDLGADTLAAATSSPISMFLGDLGYSPIARTMSSTFFRVTP